MRAIKGSSTMSSQTSAKGTKSGSVRSSRRKSSNAFTETIKEELTIPTDGPPSYEQAYNSFTNNTEYNYKSLSEIKKACLTAIDTANQEYMEQVKKLKELNDMLDQRKYELLQAQMQKHFIPEPTATEIEYKCMQRLVEAEMIVTKQQETVLKYQTDFKIAVENHQRAGKTLNDEFDRFCMDKFKTLIPPIGEEMVLTETIYENPKEEVVVQTSFEAVPQQQEDFQEKHDKLQQIMFMERKRVIAKGKEKKRWLI